MPKAHGMSHLAENSDEDSRPAGPTALRILVGAQLRRLREARGITREAAGQAIRGSHSKISRLELGRSGFKLRDVIDLLTLYGAAEDERSAVLLLAEQANAPGWWQSYRDVVPDWFEAYIGLEQGAALIRTYEVQLVPGLLQTEDYARAVITQGSTSDSSEQIERRVEVRMRRQRILTSSTPRRLWVVMDEAALHRQVGGSALMRAQLEHLQRMAELPHITLQVLPFLAGGHVGDIGPITILRFAEPELDDVVYLEQLASAQYFSRASEVPPYQHLLNDLGLRAHPAPATAAILRRIIARL
ncbi:helix-turn-helix domain-containing protein [Nonomuraea sp. M3C6]|uniref:Helix-turn-helix domain-containing protein n=1 Tax=Nonomuraea marmarensis TaxID=3351344 RepID=A0ABW7AKA3_9ACTN